MNDKKDNTASVSEELKQSNFNDPNEVGRICSNCQYSEGLYCAKFKAYMGEDERFDTALETGKCDHFKSW